MSLWHFLNVFGYSQLRFGVGPGSALFPHSMDLRGLLASRITHHHLDLSCRNLCFSTRMTCPFSEVQRGSERPDNQPPWLPLHSPSLLGDRRTKDFEELGTLSCNLPVKWKEHSGTVKPWPLSSQLLNSLLWNFLLSSTRQDSAWLKSPTSAEKFSCCACELMSLTQLFLPNGWPKWRWAELLCGQGRQDTASLERLRFTLDDKAQAVS